MITAFSLLATPLNCQLFSSVIHSACFSVEPAAQTPNLTRAGGNDRAVDNLIKKCVRTRKKVPL